MKLFQNLPLVETLTLADTIIGIKGRVGFRSISAILTFLAHHLLEKCYQVLNIN